MRNEPKEFQYIFVLEGAIIGILAGFSVALFRFMVSHAESIHDMAAGSGTPIHIFVFLIAAYIAVCLCLKLDINCSGSGIPRVKGELSGLLHTTWYKAFATMLAGSTCAIGSGLSMGQVGPSVQLGAMAAKGLSTLSSKRKKHTARFMCAGSGAGFAAILNAPLAGLAFSIEEMHKKFSTETLLTSLTACMCANFITSSLFGFAPLFAITVENALPTSKWHLLIILGIITGICGVIYNLSIKTLQGCYQQIKSIWLKVAIPVSCAAILAFTYPAALGGGNTLIYDVMNAGWTVQALLILLAVKYIFTIVCFSSGAPGGLVGPVLVIGAIIGCLFAGITEYDASMNYFMLLGMAGYFTAIVRTPLTGILLAAELSGSLAYVPSVTIICLLSHCTANLLNAQPIFDQLLENIRKTNRKGTGAVLGEK